MSLTSCLECSGATAAMNQFTAMTAACCLHAITTLALGSLYYASIGRGRESLCSDESPSQPLPDVLAYPWNCMHAKQIIIIFYICFYRTIFFLYNYLQQMYQILHLSLERCLSPARVKACKKIVRLIKRTSCNVVLLLCTHALEAIYRYII